MKLRPENYSFSHFMLTHMKGSEQQGALVHFSLFREKREKHNFFVNSQNM